MRAFVGIPLEGPEADRFLDVQDRLAVGTPVAAANLHVTLAFLDDQPVEQLEMLHEELEMIQALPFEMTMKGIDIFGGAKSRCLGLLVAPDPALMDLQADVARAARRVGMKIEKRRFRPHVTLSRFRDGQHAPEKIQGAISRGAHFDMWPISVSEFALYRSNLTSDGAQYEVLSDYPLLVMPPL
ncbi:RNA 2',3'-cyclic phosphodiesterase [Shimia sp. R10_1]|uniref:RNA 2',3'-cyclic phosphodiesterase n=1 Tax=Shimia sp. R10_1 TaxID=2821095 RepID=UPI001ADC571B|nr:RNA 2',3'-cyclic phosphodiesterase [Shimia sp. R10_1]MBO9472906.1 RNA 2',3'-cyclic phosphodiesterase [Shimia sp. R10_1]